MEADLNKNDLPLKATGLSLAYGSRTIPEGVGFVPQRCDLHPALPTTVRKVVSMVFPFLLVAAWRVRRFFGGKGRL